jgi:voltage-gated potassium channel
MLQKLKNQLVEIFEDENSQTGKFVNGFLVFLIGLSTVFFVLETTQAFAGYKNLFYWVDVFIIGVFSLEYLGRWWCAPHRTRYVFSPLALIDLFVIFSFFMAFSSLGFLRGFRVLKMFQLLKIIRYSENLLEFFKSFRSYKNEIKILGLAFFVVLILSSLSLYYLEKDINGSFQSVPDSLWWAVVTISTVGYGDAIPVTVGGKIFGGMIMFMGLGLIAILTAIVTKMFIDHFFGKKHHVCEFCHYPRHDFDARFCKNCGASLDGKKPQ